MIFISDVIDEVNLRGSETSIVPSVVNVRLFARRVEIPTAKRVLTQFVTFLERFVADGTTVGTDQTTAFQTSFFTDFTTGGQTSAFPTIIIETTDAISFTTAGNEHFSTVASTVAYSSTTVLNQTPNSNQTQNPGTLTTQETPEIMTQLPDVITTITVDSITTTGIPTGITTAAQTTSSSLETFSIRELPGSQ